MRHVVSGLRARHGGRWRVASLACSLGCSFGGLAPVFAADGVAEFYRGKTVTIVVASSPGGGYDLYGRLIARFMGRHVPGHPQVVVQNMPGAASNVAAAYINNIAPKDGTAIGAIFMGAVVEPLLGETRRLTHDASKFNYIGNANVDAYLCFVRTDAGFNSLADAFGRELVVGASAEGASTRDYPSMLKNLLGAKLKIVAGYPGTREINLAIEKGEVQGGCGQTWSSVAATYPHWFANRLVKPLVQEANVGYRELNAMGVGLVRDFVPGEEPRQVLELVYSQAAFGRPYVVAPGVPAERIAALRQAFWETMNDVELVAEAKRINVDAVPTRGEELQTLIARIYAAPAHIVEKARAALIYRP